MNARCTIMALFLLHYLIISARDIPSVFVVFGRPGSGKTAVVQLIEQKLGESCKSVDLDVCVTEKMKINFNKGIYPTHDERGKFVNATHPADALIFFLFLSIPKSAIHGECMQILEG